jgi:hypothetical protein
MGVGFFQGGMDAIIMTIMMIAVLRRGVGDGGCVDGREGGEGSGEEALQRCLGTMDLGSGSGQVRLASKMVVLGAEHI